MVLEALVQGRMRFGGKQRSPGDVISAEELAQTSPQTRDALVSQKLIVLVGEGAPGDADRYQHLSARVDRQAEEIAALKAMLNAPSDDLIAAIRDVAKRAVQEAAAKPKTRGRRASPEAI